MAFDHLETICIDTQDGSRRLHFWIPAQAPRAVILIVHGMAEHIMRYDTAAKALCGRGFAVAGADLRGHGPDCPKKHLGHFGDSGGWELLLDDVRREAEAAAGRFPGIPFMLMGHSMGSFISREYAIRSGDSLSALILSGTGDYPRPAVLSGLAIARLLPPGKPAKLLEKIVFSGNNKAFEPARTPVDWLTRDTEQTDRYLADPYCGFPFTAQAYRDFFTGLLHLPDKSRLDRMPRDLPVLFISGDRDPVGAMGKNVEKTAADFRAHGMKNVTVRLFPGARHEVLNEINSGEVLDTVCSFAQSVL